MKVRLSEHQGAPPKIIGKHVKGTLFMSVSDHMLDCGHTVAWEDFSTIVRESSYYLLETKNSFLIKNKYSQNLFLF